MIDEYDLNYEIEMLENENKQLEDKLALTEKALERCYEYHKTHSTPSDWIYHISKEEYIKEMMKSE